MTSKPESVSTDQREIEILKYQLQKRIVFLDKFFLALVLAAAGYFLNHSIETYKSSLSQALEGYKADRQQFVAEIQAERTRELAHLSKTADRV
ncbi:MAG: hypothetical protein WCA19_19690 [Candidatus Acidiferrales bacterium]